MKAVAILALVAVSLFCLCGPLWAQQAPPRAWSPDLAPAAWCDCPCPAGACVCPPGGCPCPAPAPRQVQRQAAYYQPVSYQQYLPYPGPVYQIGGPVMYGPGPFPPMAMGGGRPGMGGVMFHRAAGGCSS